MNLLLAVTAITSIVVYAALIAYDRKQAPARRRTVLGMLQSSTHSRKSLINQLLEESAAPEMWADAIVDDLEREGFVARYQPTQRNGPACPVFCVTRKGQQELEDRLRSDGLRTRS